MAAKQGLTAIWGRLTRLSLCCRSALQNTPPIILSNMVSAASVSSASISRTKTTKGSKSTLIVEAVEVLGAEDCRLAGNSRVARPVNTPFPVRLDADPP
jgi:hypothetical protein